VNGRPGPYDAGVNTGAGPGPDPRRASAVWSAVALGVAVAVAAGIVIALAYARHDHTPQVGSDSELFDGVARDPFGTGDTIVAPVVNGIAYRYGRILYPITAWTLAGGRPSLVGWTLAIVFAVSLGAAVAMAAWLLQRQGRPAWYGLAILATPFVVLWIDAPAIVAEPMVIALVLGVYVLDARRRGVAMRVTAAAAILARETAALALLPLVWRAWREDGWRGLASWAWVPLPYLSWALWVRVRIGEWPFTDPAYSRKAAISLPFAGIADVFDGAFKNAEQLTLLVGLATVILAVFVWRSRPWPPISAAALATAAIIPCLGINVWSYLFEASRVMYLPQVLGILALVGGGSGRSDEAGRATEPSSRTAAPTAVAGRSSSDPS
jgi:hypothetical protein